MSIKYFSLVKTKEYDTASCYNNIHYHTMVKKIGHCSLPCRLYFCSSVDNGRGAHGVQTTDSSPAVYQVVTLQNIH